MLNEIELSESYMRQSWELDEIELTESYMRDRVDCARWDRVDRELWDRVCRGKGHSHRCSTVRWLQSGSGAAVEPSPGPLSPQGCGHLHRLVSSQPPGQGTVSKTTWLEASSKVEYCMNKTTTWGTYFRFKPHKKFTIHGKKWIA